MAKILRFKQKDEESEEGLMDFPLYRMQDLYDAYLYFKYVEPNDRARLDLFWIVTGPTPDQINGCRLGKGYEYLIPLLESVDKEALYNYEPDQDWLAKWKKDRDERRRDHLADYSTRLS